MSPCIVAEGGQRRNRGLKEPSHLGSTSRSRWFPNLANREGNVIAFPVQFKRS